MKPAAIGPQADADDRILERNTNVGETAGDLPFWQASDQYSALAGEGHRRPPPVLGAPSLIWHLGIWPKRVFGDEDSRPSIKPAKELQPPKALPQQKTDPLPTSDEEIRKKAQRFDDEYVKFHEELSNFLEGLQRLGRISAPSTLTFSSTKEQIAAVPGGPPDAIHDFRVCQPQSLNFSLWWCDEAGHSVRNDLGNQPPQASAIRVRVHAQTFVDHATLTFYIDAGKPWSQTPVYDSKSAEGARRKRIFQNIENIRAVAASQISEGHINFDREPERGVPPGTATELKEAADYLYEGVWAEFLDAFGVRLNGPDGGFPSFPLGEIFAQSRGVVMSTPGIKTFGSEHREVSNRKLAGLAQSPPPPGTAEAQANVGLGRFATLDDESGEPNTVIKAHWPFIRRTSLQADERDFVACGILDWRALLITPLGSTSQAPIIDEASGPDWGAPGLALPERDSSKRAEAPRASRFLLLTKGEPHRQQIGRFVERIVAIETLRLFAFRNWNIVRNAGTLIRLLGRELDVVSSYWSDGRQEIEDRYNKNLAIIAKNPEKVSTWRKLFAYIKQIGSKKLFKQQEIDSFYHQQARDIRVEELNVLINKVEPFLITLTASLDKIGQGGSGKLLYVLTRSIGNINEFERLAKMLEVGNVDTWVNYQQFIDRGLKPTFDQIRATRDRLLSLRDRIQSITEIVQTSALIVETEATRSNTKTLRRIASNWWFFQSAIILTIAIFLIQMLAGFASWVFTEEIEHLQRGTRSFLGLKPVPEKTILECANVVLEGKDGSQFVCTQKQPR